MKFEDVKIWDTFLCVDGKHDQNILGCKFIIAEKGETVNGGFVPYKKYTFFYLKGFNDEGKYTRRIIDKSIFEDWGKWEPTQMSDKEKAMFLLKLENHNNE